MKVSFPLNVSRSIAAAQLSILLLAGIFIFATPTAAQTYSLPYQFRSGVDGASPYATPILDAEGNIYATTCDDGEFASGTVFKVSPSGKETVLHAFTSIDGDGDGPYAPVLLDAQGNLYGTTQLGGVYGGTCAGYGCGIIFKLDPAGQYTILHHFTGSDGSTPEQGVIPDPQGNLYGTTSFGGDYSAGVVFKLSRSGGLTVLHSFGYTDGFYPYGGNLVRDSAGNLYGTTEYGGSQSGGTIFQINSSGAFTTVYNFGSAGDGSTPRGTLVLDNAGNLYGTTQNGGSYNFGTIFKIDPSGTETILYNFSDINGDGGNPSASLVRDSAGNLFGATGSGGAHYLGTIFKLDSSNQLTILHNFTGYDGRSPEYGMVLDSKGTLYGTTFLGGHYGGGVVFKLVP